MNDMSKDKISISKTDRFSHVCIPFSELKEGR